MGDGILTTDRERAAMDGINRDRVTNWLRDHTVVTPPLTFVVIPGGRSNLTYRVSDAGGRRWVLRRPPLHSVLSSAHDVGREYRMVAALQDTEVPVPPLVGLEQDDAVTGAPFYVMEFVDGLVLREAEDVVAALDEEARRQVAFNLADTLADLHGVDVDRIGVADSARGDGYIERQLRRWLGQYAKGSRRELPLVQEVHDRLAAAIPEQAETAIVHGDYRLDNLLVGPDGSIRAVLDWELSTVGDPLADVGLLQVYWKPLKGTAMPGFPTAGMAPGIPEVEEVIARYAERSGRDVSQLDFYVTFGYWKLALILEGVYTRFASGAYGAPDGSAEIYGKMVIQLLERSAQTSRAGSR